MTDTICLETGNWLAEAVDSGEERGHYVWDVSILYKASAMDAYIDIPVCGWLVHVVMFIIWICKVMSFCILVLQHSHNPLSNTQFYTAIAECGDPGTPVEGSRKVLGTTEGATVIYSCQAGYSLSGDVQRTCLQTGEWSGSLPTCNSKMLTNK